MNKRSILKNIVLALINSLLIIALCFPALAAETVEILDPNEFTGKSLAICQGSCYVPVYGDLIPDPQVSFFNSDADCATALIEGKVDAFMADSGTVLYCCDNAPGIKVGKIEGFESNLGFVFQKGGDNQKLLDEMNAFIREYKENGKLEELQKKWLEGDEDGRVMEQYSDPDAPNGKITVAVCLGFPPFDYMKNGEVVGFDPELVNEFGKYAGYDVELVSMEFSSIIPSIVSGKYDLGSSAHTITEERKQSVDFSDSVYTNYAALAYREEEPLLTAEDFTGKRIAVASGGTYVGLVEKYIKDPKVYTFSGLPDETTALLNNKVDGVIEENTMLSYVAAQNPGMKVTRVSDDTYYTAVVSNKTEEGQAIIDEYNETISHLKESGRLDEIYDSWFTHYTYHEVEDYTKLPATNGEIHVATEGMLPPFWIVSEDRYTGYEAEILYEFCKEHGYKPIISTVAFDGIISGVTSGKFDIGSSGFSITEERKQTVIFSDPICECWPSVAYMSDNTVKKESFIDSVKASFNRTFVEDDRWKLFLGGMGVTFNITVLSIIAGSIIGFVSHLLCRKGQKIPNLISRFLRWLIEGMPIVVFLMILFYIIFGDSKLSGMWVATIGFTIIFACFIHGMLETGERAVDRGQYVAAKAMGYSDEQAFFLIILPQALKYSAPLFFSELTTHIKATAVVGYIAVMDITKIGDLIRGMTYDAFFPLIAVAVLYFVMAGILKMIAKSVLNSIKKDQGSEVKIMKGIRPL